MGFADELRAANADAWERAVAHPFTVELGDGTLHEAAMRRYLIQDYQFVETLVSMAGYGVAKAPTMTAKALLSGFLAAVTSAENTYFQRCFDALGVPPADRTAPVLHPVAADFLEAMRDAGETGGYVDVIATLLPAEWIYLDWARRQAPKRPAGFIHWEWIELHANPGFQDFVMGLKAELDALGPTLSDTDRARAAARFRRMVELEVAFFEAMYLGS